MGTARFNTGENWIIGGLADASTVTVWSGMGNLPGSTELDVLEIEGLVVDSSGWRRYPTGQLARLHDPSHQGSSETVVVIGGQPIVPLAVPLVLADDLATGRDVEAGKDPDPPVEPAVGQGQLEVDAMPFEFSVPAVDTSLGV